MAKKIKIGDMFSIKTSKGKVYLHCLKIEKGDEIVRVLDGFFPSGCVNLDALANKPERFFLGFPVNAAYSRKIIDLEGYVSAETYPVPNIMRSTMKWPDGVKHYIVDVKTLKRKQITELTADYLALSPFGRWNDTLLIERLETGWKLEDWK
jgi:hypothetical protein